ncbi:MULTISPECIES: alternative ribosome rescue aminoacyl-tRNA hydrolase ArfB [Tessaracoccus]|uniref:alternative ribosome rescue aminoacyl-tRNA hydrolase ArfB n=1 Tax=Tessaracoccus TaxID=72763 RepID=UPI00099CC85C|nr:MULTISPECIES: alternative ribosome rescue aminoacyl-tRNA hydrolase ArfB [Tessaracoccus]AQX16173.1 aminoacyl-tRNA hydrolase [Tessaracoccus sp. T2.5-30]
MSDLRIPPGPGLPAGLVVPASELIERYSHSSGPGGQGVNTADSRVQLSFDIAASSVLDETQRDRLLHRLRTRLAGPVVTVVSTATRSQRQNRIDARDRLAAILREGLAPPSPPRRRTRPTKGSVERRLAAKRRRGEAKRDRARPEGMSA